MLSLKIMITAVGLLATGALAASSPAASTPATLPNISCGDHWFEIDVETVNDLTTLHIKGDSVHGDTPVYTPKVKITRDEVKGIDTFAFSFGDSPESAQTLVTNFKIGRNYGDGVYSLVEHDLQTNMNCLLK